MNNRHDFEKGDRVRVICVGSTRKHKVLGPTIYEVMTVCDGYDVEIAEVRKDGKVYANQPFDVSLLHRIKKGGA